MPDNERTETNVPKKVDDMLCEAQRIGKLCGVNSAFEVMYGHTGQFWKFIDVLSEYKKKGSSARDILRAFNDKGENISSDDYIDTVAKAAYAFLAKKRSDASESDNWRTISHMNCEIQDLVSSSYRQEVSRCNDYLDIRTHHR